MSFRLKKSERCPIHNNVSCSCHPQPKTAIRTVKKGWTQIAPGVRQKVDSFGNVFIHRSPAAMKELLKKKVREQGGCCFYCGVPFSEWTDVTPDHRNPRGCYGANKDDSEENIVAACAQCNSKKGSRRDFSQQVQG